MFPFLVNTCPFLYIYNRLLPNVKANGMQELHEVTSASKPKKDLKNGKIVYSV